MEASSDVLMVIVADLGLFRAYRVAHAPVGGPQPAGTPVPASRAHLELVDEWRPPEAHAKLHDQVTDMAGRFPGGSAQGPAVGDLSNGERHGIEQELDRRLVQGLARRIDRLLKDDHVRECFLAASAPIHHTLLHAISPGAKRKIGRILASDLAKVPPSELLGHFGG